MTWCDKLASTPAVGYQFDPYFLSGDRILDAISAKTNPWFEKGKPLFSISKHESFIVELQHENGFTYSVSETRASVSFQHRLKLRNTSAGLPIAEFTSKPLQYSKVLEESLRELVDISSLLSESANRTINRVGIVTSTVASKEDLPPGILRMLDYVGRPWQNGIKYFNMALTTELNSNEKHSERCTHAFAKVEGDENELVTVTFDWQRDLVKPISVIRGDLEKLNQSATKAALSYFEELAVGNFFDEHIIRDRAESKS